MPRSKSFCASGLQDVSKCTLPSLLSPVCPRAERASETPDTAIAATASDVLFMMLLLVGAKTERGAVIASLDERSLRPAVRRAAVSISQSRGRRSRGHDTLRWRSGCDARHIHTCFLAARVGSYQRQRWNWSVPVRRSGGWPRSACV